MSRKSFTKSAKNYNITNNIYTFILKEPLKTRDKQRTSDYFFLTFTQIKCRLYPYKFLFVENANTQGQGTDSF